MRAISNNSHFQHVLTDKFAVYKKKSQNSCSRNWSKSAYQTSITANQYTPEDVNRSPCGPLLHIFTSLCQSVWSLGSRAVLAGAVVVPCCRWKCWYLCRIDAWFTFSIRVIISAQKTCQFVISIRKYKRLHYS